MINSEAAASTGSRADYSSDDDVVEFSLYLGNRNEPLALPFDGGVVKVHHKFKKTGQMGSQEQVQKEESLELEPAQRASKRQHKRSSLKQIMPSP